MKRNHRRSIAFFLVLCLVLVYMPIANPSFGVPWPSTESDEYVNTSVGEVVARVGWSDDGGNEFYTGGANIGITEGTTENAISFAVVLMKEDGSTVSVSDLDSVVSEAALRLLLTSGGVVTEITSAAFEPSNLNSQMLSPSPSSVSWVPGTEDWMVMTSETGFVLDMMANGDVDAGDYIVEIKLTLLDGTEDGTEVSDWIEFNVHTVQPRYISVPWYDSQTIAVLNTFIENLTENDLRNASADGLPYSTLYAPIYITLPAVLTTGGAATIVLSKPVGLIGVSGSSPIVQGNLIASYAGINEEEYKVNVENVTFDGSEGDNASMSWVGVTSDSYNTFNFSLTNCIVTGFGIGVQSNSETFEIIRTTVSDCAIGLEISKSSFGAYDAVQNCTFNGNGTAIKLTNSPVETTTTNDQQGNLFNNFYNIRIKNNIFNNNLVAIELDGSSTKSLYATHNTFYQTPTYSGIVEVSPYYDGNGYLQIETGKPVISVLGADNALVGNDKISNSTFPLGVKAVHLEKSI